MSDFNRLLPFFPQNQKSEKSLFREAVLKHVVMNRWAKIIRVLAFSQETPQTGGYADLDIFKT